MIDKDGLYVADGTIQGSYIKLGGPEGGWIDVRDSNDNRVAQFTGSSLMFIDPDTGTNRIQISKDAILIMDNSGNIWGQLTKTAFILFNADNNKPPTLQATRDSIILNTEHIYVGTNSNATYQTENNTHTVVLPYSVGSSGNITGAYMGVFFVNGMLPQL